MCETTTPFPGLNWNIVWSVREDSARLWRRPPDCSSIFHCSALFARAEHIAEAINTILPSIFIDIRDIRQNHNKVKIMKMTNSGRK